jgi:hypothetical protein
MARVRVDPGAVLALRPDLRFLNVVFLKSQRVPPVSRHAEILMASRAELRRKPRRQFHYNASVLLDSKSSPQACAIVDISATGARIVLQSECELPERFILLLTRGGEARRHCRLVWRDGLAAGVEFPAQPSQE